jgi:hypothetical protein
MNRLTILLCLILTLLSCGRDTENTPGAPTPPPTYLYSDNGKKFLNSKIPLIVNVPRNKYDQYRSQFDEVETEVRSQSGKALITFVPSDSDPKFIDQWDSGSLFTDYSEMWVLFKEDPTQFTNLDDGSAAVALTWNYDDGTIAYGQIIMDFTMDQWTPYNFNQVLYHEVLHLIGFAHTFDDDLSVMNYEYVYNIDGMSELDNDRVAQKYNFTLRWDQLKDLGKLGANSEVLEREAMAGKIEENYGLSEERSSEVAKVLYHYQKIEKKRSLTEMDKNILSKKLLGIDYKSAKFALEEHIQGKPDQLESVLEKAAKANNTSPEHVQELVGEFLLR